MAVPAEPTYAMTMPAEAGAPVYTTEMPAYTIQSDAAMPVTYTTAAPYTIPGAYTSAAMPGAYTVQSMPAAQVYTGEPQYTYLPAGDMSAYQPYMPAVSGLDHSQGKWFAPGEALPPGYVITAHPEGHTAPQSDHAMTDMARESFVITGAAASAALPKSSAPEKKSKKSKKKKSSGCC
mmetsp:Transcript_10423/g.19484  ORF Transcript_10423/g.19484 Transcript_10423/m.19484 type:complete len:178 (-) Transcript_10423:241-774(-)